MMGLVLDALLDWYAEAGRDLPWRRPGTSPWGVLVSEVMLQQTPVARVLPAYDAWLTRWPTPANLASSPAGDAVRQWGTLGYPRRALNLHKAAQLIVRDHHGEVPRDVAALKAMSGIGDYTARAVAAFAYRRREPVVDSNVARVLSRVMRGQPDGSRSVSARDRALAESLLPPAGAVAARWSVAVMELGALVCTSRQPRCSECPLQRTCRWRELGHPGQPLDRRQPYVGTDRQARGRLLALMRDAEEVDAEALTTTWTDDVQRDRALASLIADGLAICTEAGTYRLPR